MKKRITLWGILLAMLFLTLPVSAEKATKHLTHDFVTHQNITTHVILNSSVQSTIYSGAIVTIEEGCTLTVYGNLVVNGTLVNKGKLRIISSEKKGTLPGLVENNGVLHNQGRIEVSTGNMRNRPGGSFVNAGEMILQGDTEKIILFVNLAPTSFDGVKKPGKILNEGSIFINNTKGWGFVNHGVVINQGSITKGEKGTVSGVVLGEETNQEKALPRTTPKGGTEKTQIFPDTPGENPKIQPEIQPKIQPEIQPKIQPEVQPEVQPETQVPTASPEAEKKAEISIDDFLKNRGQAKF